MNSLLSAIQPRQPSEEALKALVWLKGHPIPGLDPAQYRSDDLGTWMEASRHGDQDHPYGWHMDHYPVPKALGGTDDLDNLRPLNWKSNCSHGGLLGGLLQMIKQSGR